MIIHPRPKYTIEELNSFFENGFKILEKLEQSKSPHAEYNIEMFRRAIGDAWLEASRSFFLTYITTDDL